MFGALVSSAIGGPWGEILGGVTDVASGDLLGIGGTLLTKSLGLFGQGTSTRDTTSELANLISEKAMDMWKSSAQSAAGYTGAAAETAAQAALNKPLLTASAIQDANRARQAASKLGDIASMISQKSLEGATKTAGRTLGEASTAIRAMGGPASAVAAGLSKVGSSLGDIYDRAVESSMGAQSQAAQAQMQASGIAQDILGKAKETEFQTRVQPYLVQRDNLASITGALAPTLGSHYSQRLERMEAPQNALPGLTGMFRQAGAGRFGMGQMQQFEQKISPYDRGAVDRYGWPGEPTGEDVRRAQERISDRDKTSSIRGFLKK